MPVHEGDDPLLRNACMGCVNHADRVWADAWQVGSRGVRGPRAAR